MAEGIPARLTPAEGRKFGLTVGGAFLAIGALLWWRGRTTGAPVAGGLGLALALGGLLAPGALGPVYDAWMGLSRILSKVTTPIFMGAMYFLVFTPVALFMRVIGRKTLVHPAHDGSYWIERAVPAPDAESMRRQF
jgi:hypothetical protein